MSRTALDVLLSIEALLKHAVKQGPSGSSATVAPDSDLLGKYGDPELRFMPRDWTGESYKGRLFSECPAELLDMVADSLDWFAEKADEENRTTSSGKPVAPYNRKDASRARGWAKRMRDGRHTPPSATSGDAGWAEAPSEDDIPF